MAEAKTPPIPVQPDAAQAQSAPGFRFEGLAVTNIQFRELALAPLSEGESRPTMFAIGLNISVGFDVAGGDRARVKLSVDLTPDPKAKPYEIHVDFEGRFQCEGMTKEQIETFCRASAPSLLFPYVREMVDRVTSDGRYGSLRLDPMFLGPMIAQEGQTQMEKP